MFQKIVWLLLEMKEECKKDKNVKNGRTDQGNNNYTRFKTIE